MEKISIIVPVYNAENTLGRCIDSVLEQTSRDYELVLVDDGSTDSSGVICDEYAAAHPTVYVYHIANQGVSHARNYGVSKSTGKYVTFVDADDFLAENALEILSRGKGKLTYFSIGKYCLDTNCFEKPITHIRTQDVVLADRNSAISIEEMDLLAIGYPYGKLFDMAILRKYNIKFDERIKNHEDHIFCFDYLLHVDEIHTEVETGYFWTYRMQSTSLSHLTPPYINLLIASDAFIERYRKLWNKLPYLSSNYKKRMTGEYGVGTRRAAIYSLYHNKENKDIRKTFFKEQTGIFFSLLCQYGYHTTCLRHKLVYIFVAIPIVPIFVKDFILRKLYE